MFNSKPITASQEVPPSPSSIDTTNITVEGDVEAWKKEKVIFHKKDSLKNPFSN